MKHNWMKMLLHICMQLTKTKSFLNLLSLFVVQASKFKDGQKLPCNVPDMKFKSTITTLVKWKKL